MSEEEQLTLALQMSMSSISMCVCACVCMVFTMGSLHPIPGFDTVEALGPPVEAMETDQVGHLACDAK